ncbi:MAG: protein-disulfide reductase DsbD domain-containing protein [Methylophilus sp.]|jgi:thiol:disulfide interchange protein DsbD
MKLKYFSYWLGLIGLLIFSLSTNLVYAGNSSTSKSAFFEQSEDDFLSPDVAFQLEVTAQDQQTLQAQFKVEPGYYLYKDRIKFSIKDASTGSISAVNLPAGEIKDDPNFGKQEVYHHDFTANIQLSNANSPIVQASYQGCSEKGLCYAPQTKTFNLAATGSTSASAQDDTQQGQSANLLKSGKWWLIILGFFGAGLLLAFTPCVFPMIPILSSIIIGKNAHLSRLHAFNLSLAYTLGMALTYTLMGIAAGLSGQLLSNALQTPWALGIGAQFLLYWHCPCLDYMS